MLDPRIVNALTSPVTESGGLSDGERAPPADGRRGPADEGDRGGTRVHARGGVGRGRAALPALAQQASTGTQSALQRLRLLHRAIVDREEQGESLSRMLPGGLAQKLREQGVKPGETERLTVTVLMSDIRAYSTIAEMADPSVLAGQLHEHRAEMNHAVLGENGTVMQFVGDAVMAVFGAPFPQPDQCERAVAAAEAMHARQAELNARWEAAGLPPFHLGIGVSTGDVAAALLGSDERLEYSVVGDAVEPRAAVAAVGGGRPDGAERADVRRAVSTPPDAERLDPALVKGRQTPVGAYRIGVPVAGVPA